MKITADIIIKAGYGTHRLANVESLVVALYRFGAAYGLGRPHRAAHFLAQTAHESGGYRYDRELWGPTPAQIRYEGRKDLGNIIAGDGKRFLGRTAMQLTGRMNYTKFLNWCIRQGYTPPDFTADPDAVTSDPWEGLVPIWFWEDGWESVPSVRSLNDYADENNIEMISRRINGGLNGYADRLNWYTRFGLVMLGYGAAAVAEFQTFAGLERDGVSGPRTRAAIHSRLMNLGKDIADDPPDPIPEVSLPIPEPPPPRQPDDPGPPEPPEPKASAPKSWWERWTEKGAGGAPSLGFWDGR